MILETAQFDIKPGMEAEFEAAVGQARPLFSRAKGCLGLSLRRVIEAPARYVLLIEWATLEDHTVGFRESADFQAWRALVGPCFATAPEVIHSDEVRWG
jgi:heme-degrading monooxygenase HmoA